MLFVTPETVEFHLRHVDRKLDIPSSRADLVRVLPPRGLRITSRKCGKNCGHRTVAFGPNRQEELVSFAIVDAAAGGDARACGCAGRSRYCTPIANLPLIYHVLDELRTAGTDRVRVIVSPGGRDELEQVLAGGRPWGAEVSYTTAAEHDRRMATLDELEQVVAGEPVLVYPGDCLFPGQVSAMWARFSAGDVDAVVLDARERRGPPQPNCAGRAIAAFLFWPRDRRTPWCIGHRRDAERR